MEMENLQPQSRKNKNKGSLKSAQEIKVQQQGPSTRAGGCGEAALGTCRCHWPQEVLPHGLSACTAAGDLRPRQVLQGVATSFNKIVCEEAG